jgi:hypothetical protein
MLELCHILIGFVTYLLCSVVLIRARACVCVCVCVCMYVCMYVLSSISFHCQTHHHTSDHLTNCTLQNVKSPCSSQYESFCSWMNDLKCALIGLSNVGLWGLSNKPFSHTSASECFKTHLTLASPLAWRITF